MNESYIPTFFFQTLFTKKNALKFQKKRLNLATDLDVLPNIVGVIIVIVDPAFNLSAQHQLNKVKSETDGIEEE